MKNNKAFVLAESIVTAVFVLSFFSFLIANLLPLVAEYEKNLSYDNVESKYNTHLIKKMLLKDDLCRVFNLVDFPLSDYSLDDSYQQVFYEFDKTDICLYLKNENYCKTLLSSEFLDVKKIIITEYNARSIKEISYGDNTPFDRMTNEYLKYMPEYKDDTLEADVIQRRLIVVFNDGTITNSALLVNIDSTCLGGNVCAN